MGPDSVHLLVVPETAVALVMPLLFLPWNETSSAGGGGDDADDVGEET